MKTDYHDNVDNCSCTPCQQRRVIAKLLARIESLKGALRGAIDAHAANAGEWVQDERIINARRALKGKA